MKKLDREIIDYLQPIDTSHVTHDSWVRMINDVCDPEKRILTPLRLYKELTGGDWAIYCHDFHTLHWLIKIKWHSEHKVPETPESDIKGKDYESCYLKLAELYKNVVNLCTECFSEKCGYKNDAEWFRLIFLEKAIEGGNISNEGKTVDRVTIQRQNRRLNLDKEQEKDLDMEEKDLIDQKEFPHTWLLIKVARNKAEDPDKSMDLFRKDFWSPFIRSRKAWATELQGSEWDGTQIVDDELRRTQRGQGTVRFKRIVVIEKDGKLEFYIE